MSSHSLLRPHQLEPYQHLLQIFGRARAAVDLSDCGTGKTYVACAVIKALNTATLVVCPKIAQTQWREAAAHFGDSVSVIGYEKLRMGKTPYGCWENPPPQQPAEYFQCQCCQLRVDFDRYQGCYTHPAGIHCIQTKKLAWNYGNFIFHPAVETVVFDEVQRCGGLDSLNADLLLAARRQDKRILGLSATLATTPLQLRAIGYALNLFARPQDFGRWVRQFGVRYDAAFHGLHWFAGADRQSEVMAAIRSLIVPEYGVRVTTDSIPGFPAVDIHADLYDVEQPNEINRVYEELAILAQKDSNIPVTEQLRACQRVELLKVPLAVELAEDYLAKGYSVGIFVNFRQTMGALSSLLECDCIIDGTPEGVKRRQKHIEDFQSARSRLILVNSAAGGLALSLPDKTGDAPRVGLVFPGFSAERIKQVFGRFPRDGGKSKSIYKVLLAAGTEDVKIHRALKAKLNCLDALNDADLMPQNLELNKIS